MKPVAVAWLETSRARLLAIASGSRNFRFTVACVTRHHRDVLRTFGVSLDRHQHLDSTELPERGVRLEELEPKQQVL